MTISTIPVLAFLALNLARAAQAELPPIIPREVLFGNPIKATPKISPDGKRLAYLAPEKDVLNVWIQTIGKTDDHVATADKKRGVRRFFWQQDSEHIIYLQDQKSTRLNSSHSSISYAVFCLK